MELDDTGAGLGRGWVGPLGLEGCKYASYPRHLRRRLVKSVYLFVKNESIIEFDVDLILFRYIKDSEEWRCMR